MKSKYLHYILAVAITCRCAGRPITLQGLEHPDVKLEISIYTSAPKLFDTLEIRKGKFYFHNKYIESNLQR